MTNDISTPTKFIDLDCFICQKTNLSIKYKLNGRKLLKYEFRDKFLGLIGHEFSLNFDSIFEEASVCRNCFSSFERFVEFKRDLVHSLIYTPTRRVKRAAHFSPEVCHHEEDTEKDNDDSELKGNYHMQRDEIFTTPSDHGYSSLPWQKSKCRETKRSLFPENEENSVTSEPMSETQGLSHDTPYIRSVSDMELKTAKILLEQGDLSALVAIPSLRHAAERLIINDLSSQTNKLLDRRESSMLLKNKSMFEISKCENFLGQIYTEIENRVPFLLEILKTVCNPERGNADPKKLKASIAVVYGILMFRKDPELSAVQRMLTAICIRGRIEDMAITRLNLIGITMSTSTKLRLLDECQRTEMSQLVTYLKNNPLIKITGDNLDIFIKSGSQSINNPNIDLHLFASNAISSRITSMDMDNASQPIRSLSPQDIVGDYNTKQLTLMAYKHLICQILVEKNGEDLRWIHKLTPAHLYHPYQREMSKPSHVFQLPIMFKNEAKYEDCLDIMDQYESILENVFVEAHGDSNTLDSVSCVLGGDQLTRVRMEGAKDLRSLSITRKERLEHLNPIVCELWHLKADFLEKLFKRFYKADSAGQPGTLAYYRNLIRKTSVNGNVKSNFKAHADFLLLVVKELLNQKMGEFLKTKPDLTPADMCKKTEGEKKKILNNILNRFIIMLFSPPNITDTPDYLFGYSQQLCEWGLHYMTLDNTAKEGDITRVIPNLQKSIPFFFSHSKLSKYLTECVNYIIQYENASQQQKLRILEGSFVNRRGGIGNNIEADLVQEHSVRHQKELIRGLGKNKTERAIKRATSASNLINTIIDNFDEGFGLHKRSHHSNSTNPADTEIIENAMLTIKPCQYQPGRLCQNFKLSANLNVNKHELFDQIRIIKTRIENGFIRNCEEDDADYNEDGLPSVL